MSNTQNKEQKLLEAEKEARKAMEKLQKLLKVEKKDVKPVQANK